MLKLLIVAFCLIIDKGAVSIRTVFLNEKQPLDELSCLPDCPQECLRTDLNLPWFPKFSYCYRAKGRSWVGGSFPYMDIIQIGKNRNDERMAEGFLYGTYQSGPWIGFSSPDTEVLTWYALSTHKDPFPQLRWKHHCMTIDYNTGEIALYFDALRIFKDKFPGLPEIYRKWSGPVDYASAGCVKRNVGLGKMSAPVEFTDVQIYNRVLTQEEVQEYVDCNAKMGEVSSWESSNWYTEAALGRTVEHDRDFRFEVCANRDRSYIHLPYRIPYKGQAQHFCSRFSADLISYSTEVEYGETLRNITQAKYLRRPEGCVAKKSDTEYEFRTWVAADYAATKFLRPKDKKEISYLPWFAGRPWGGEFECLNLVANLRVLPGNKIRIESSTVQDEKCHFLEACASCMMKRPAPTLKIRGLCDDSILDRNYVLELDQDGTPVLIGEKMSLLKFDTNISMWKWTDNRQKGEYAIINKPEKSLLMGYGIADFAKMNDKCFLNVEDKRMNVVFTACEDGYYTCQDGQCIDIETRCDQFPNCKDGSDEQNCKSLVINGNYNKKIPPFQVNRETNEIMKAKINVSVIVIDILQIVEVDLEYTCKFKMILEWFDYRLEFWNLKEQESSNALAKDEEEKIWLPNLVFSNTESNDITAGDEKSELVAVRKTSPQRSSISEVEEINIYQGAKSILKFQRIYTKTFRCVYQLHMYPFDTQICTIDLEVRNLDRFGIEMIPEFIDYAGDVVLTQYILTKYELIYSDPDNQEDGIQLKLTLKRRLLNEIMTTYLPTTLVLVIVYATNFFKDFFFETVISVNLTALLVLTTLFVNVSSYLPKTAYLKMIDIWLLFAQFIPFFEVLLHTWLDLQRVTGDEGKTDDDDEAYIKHSKSALSLNSVNTTVTPLQDGDNPLQLNFSGKGTASLINVKGVDGKLATENLKEEKPSATDLISRNEKEKVDKRKDFYGEAANADNNKYLAIGEMIAVKGILIFFLIFTFLYWVYGLQHFLRN